MRKLLVVASVGAVFAILAAHALASTRSVKVGDNYFVRPSGVPTVTVRTGTTVVWRFAGASAHTVAVKRGPVKFHSRALTSGTFRRKLTRTGTYLIYCTIHGATDQSMRLKVR